MFEPVEGDTGVTENAMPEAVKEGSAFSSLEQLDLAGCAIDDTAAFAGHLSRFHPNLRSLDLSGTSVTGTFPCRRRTAMTLIEQRRTSSLSLTDAQRSRVSISPLVVGSMSGTGAIFSRYARTR